MELEASSATALMHKFQFSPPRKDGFAATMKQAFLGKIMRALSARSPRTQSSARDCNLILGQSKWIIEMKIAIDVAAGAELERKLIIKLTAAREVAEASAMIDFPRRRGIKSYSNFDARLSRAIIDDDCLKFSITC